MAECADRVPGAVLEGLLTVDDVARWLGLSAPTIYRLVQGARIPAYKVGGAWRFSRPELLTWLERRRPRRESADEKALRAFRKRGKG